MITSESGYFSVMARTNLPISLSAYHMWYHAHFVVVFQLAGTALGFQVDVVGRVVRDAQNHVERVGRKVGFQQKIYKFGVAHAPFRFGVVSAHGVAADGVVEAVEFCEVANLHPRGLPRVEESRGVAEAFENGGGGTVVARRPYAAHVKPRVRNAANQRRHRSHWCPRPTTARGGRKATPRRGRGFRA